MEDTQVMDLDYTFGDEETTHIIGWIEVENKRHELKEGEIKIGRDPATCKIVIDNEKTLSKEHAVLDMDKTSVTLMDLGSRNKTKIGKMVLKPNVRYALQGGEKIKFGAVQAKFFANEQSRDSDSDVCSLSVLDSPSKKGLDSNQSSDSSVISPTPQVSNNNFSSISKGINITKAIAQHRGESSTFVSPTPQSSTSNGRNVNRSLDFIPETPANNSSFMSVSGGKDSFATQSTPFTSYARSGLKDFTSPAFLSPITDMNIDGAKTSLKDSHKLKNSGGVGSPITMKLDETGDNEGKEDYNTDESTDVEDLFADETEAKKKNKNELDDSVDICAQPTQKFMTDKVDAPAASSHVENDDTQEIFAAFDEDENKSHEEDSTQDVFEAFEKGTQAPFGGELAECATQQFDKTSSGTLFRKPFAAALKPKLKSPRVGMPSKEKMDIYDAPTQIFLPLDRSRNAENSDESDNDDIFNMPTQKFSDRDSRRESKDKDDIFDAPTQVFKEPIDDVCDAPTQLFNAPTQVFEAPEICDAPTQIFDAPTQIFNASIQIFDAPTQVYNAPTQLVDSSPRKRDGPLKKSEDNADVSEDHTQKYEVLQDIDVSTSSAKKNYVANNSNSISKVTDSSKENAMQNISLDDEYGENENTLPVSNVDDDNDNFDSTQKFDSDNEENDVPSNLPTVPVDKIKTHDSNLPVDEAAESDDDTDSNASETLLQNEEPVEDLEQTQKFSYSLISSEQAKKSDENDKSTVTEKEDACQTDTDDTDSCASDTLLKIDNEEEFKTETVEGYNSDESTDVEDDETILFTKSNLSKENIDDKNASTNKSLDKENVSVKKSSFSKENVDDTNSVVNPLLAKVNIAANVSSATNETEENDLSKLELTGDSTTLPEREISGNKAPNVKKSEESKVSKVTSLSAEKSTYDSQFNTPDFSYSCFEIDSSILTSDDSKSPVKKSVKDIDDKVEEKLIPSKLNHIDEEIEELDLNDLDTTSKSQTLFDLSNDSETSDNESCLIVTPLADKNALTSTPAQKTRKKLNLAAEMTDTEKIELPDLDEESEKFSEGASKSHKVNKDTTQTSEPVRGTRLSRRNKDKLEDSEALTKKGTSPDKRRKTKLGIITQKVDSVGKRTKRTENLDKSSLSEETETKNNKKFRTSVESEVIGTEITQASKQSLGRTRNVDSESSGESSKVDPEEKHLSPSVDSGKRRRQNIENKSEIKNENHDALDVIGIPDEKPICNKPYQKPSPVAESVSSPEVKTVRTTRRGRKSAAPSRYSPSKADQTSDRKRSVDSIDINNDAKCSSKKSKVEVQQRKSKNSDKSTSEINISASSKDINIASCDEENLITDTSQKTETNANFKEMVDKELQKLHTVEKEIQKLQAKTNQKGKKSVSSEMTNPRIKTRLNVSDTKDSSSPVKPPVHRVTRHVQNLQTDNEVNLRDSKSVNIGKRKAEKTDIESTSVAKRRGFTTDAESKSTGIDEKANEDKNAKSTDSISVIPDLKNEKVISPRTEDSKSVRSRSSRLKAKNFTEKEVSQKLNIVEAGLQTNDSKSLRESRKSKSVKAKETLEKLIPEVKEETMINDTHNFVKPVRSSRASKSKTIKDSNEISITSVDKEKLILSTKSDDALNIRNFATTEKTTVRRSRRAGNEDDTDVVEKIDIRARTSKTKICETANKKTKCITPEKNIKEKTITPIANLPKTSTRHSQRIELEKEDKSGKEDCLSICSFSSAASDTMDTNKKRGRPSKAPPAAVRKSARGESKLVKVESELEMSIISKDSSQEETEAPNKKKPRGKLNTTLSPTRSTRSKRSRGDSPSFSKEEMLWSPAQRQSMASKQPRVLFTAFKDNNDEEIVKKAGGRVVNTASECTVLVTNALKRTCKLLACVGKGVPIVSPDWIIASKRAQGFVDPWQYLITDLESEKKFGFSLKNSLKTAAKKKLLSGYSIYVTDSVKPPPNDMREIIECAGGEYMDTPPKISSPKVFIVSCDQDKKLWTLFKKINVPVVNNEFILTGLLRQKIMIKEYKINI